MIGDLTWKEDDIHPADLAPYTDTKFGRPIKTKMDLHVMQSFLHKTTPILRRLDSMTDSECIEFGMLVANDQFRGYGDEAKIHQVRQLLSGIFNQQTNLPGIKWIRAAQWLYKHSFDIHSLIDAGEAIDKNTITE